MGSMGERRGIGLWYASLHSLCPVGLYRSSMLIYALAIVLVQYPRSGLPGSRPRVAASPAIRKRLCLC